jgi:dephospho-CoA kinase
MPSDRSPMRVALTGGIATGKSHCLRAFAALGVYTVDSDVLAREAVEPGTAGLEAVLARFGRVLLRPDGTLDRTALGRIVFADPAARRDLEAIIHPLVYAAIEARVGSPSRQPRASEPDVLSITDIPLLYESGHAQDFDTMADWRENEARRLRHRYVGSAGRHRPAGRGGVGEGQGGI